jgi:DNA-binding XRE family transcriptional regulator
MLGATQEEIAERAGISREQLVRLEAQKCAPSLRTALALGEALDADPVSLFADLGRT